jgi:tetratricopeptide (TPR) repeat protein
LSIRCVLAGLLLLPIAGRLAGAEGGEGAAVPAVDPARLRAVVTNPSVLSGDPVGSRRFWLDRASEAPNAPSAELAFRMVGNQHTQRLPSPDPMENSLRLYLASDPVNGCAADAARRLLVSWLLMRDAFEEAEALTRDGGALLDWQSIGPFGDYGAASFRSTFSPEEGVDSLDGVHATRCGEAAWRPLWPDPFSLSMEPYAGTPPHVGGVVYLFAQVQNDAAARRAWVHLDTTASWTLWINGERTGGADQMEAYLPREQYVPVFLRKGWNRVLLKIYARGGATSLRVRLTDRHGRPLPDLKAAPPEDRTLHAIGPVPAQQPSLEGEPPRAVRLVRDAAVDHPSDGGLQGALAWLELLDHRPDRALKAAETAVRLEPEELSFRLLSAEIAAKADHLPPEIRASRTRRRHAGVLKRFEECVPSILALAQLDILDQQPRAALERLRAALAIQPESVEALQLRAELGIEKDWMDPLYAWTDALRERAPGTIAARRTAARAAGARRRPRQAAEAWTAARKADSSRLSLWFAELESLERLGEQEASDALAQRMDAIASRHADVQARLARHYARFEDWSRARAHLDRAIALRPCDQDLLRGKGDLLLQAGERKEALDAYEASLELAPDQHDLRRLIAELEQRPYDFWSEYAIDGIEALRRSRREDFPGSTVRLIDQTVMRIYPDGSHTESVHQLLKALTENGIPEARKVPIFGEVLSARTLLPNGKTLEPIRLSGRSSFDMPHIRPGGASEYRYLVEHGARYDRGMHGASFYFRSPNGNEMFALSQYIVQVPEDYPFTYVQRNFETPPQVETRNGLTTYIWTMRRTEPVWKEDGNPPIDEWLPFVEISSKETWEDVAQVIRAGYAGRLRPTVELHTLVDRLLDGAQTPRQRVLRLYRHVLETIEETGHGQGDASEIWARRRGGRVPLLLVLLRIAGVEAWPAAVRPADEVLYRPNWALPLVDHFPYRLVAVKLPEADELLWLDLRYRDLGAGQLLEDTAGATAFLVQPRRASFHTLPLRSARSFVQKEDRALRLKPDEDAIRVEGEAIFRGSFSMKMKERLRLLSERNRLRMIERHLADTYHGATAESVEILEDRPGRPLRFAYDARVENLFSGVGRQRLATGLGLQLLDLVPNLERDPDRRRNPFQLKGYTVRDDTVTLHIPDGWTLAQGPEELLLKTRFGEYQLRVSRGPGELRITRRAAFRPQFVERDAYRDLVELARRIRETEEQQVVIAPGR